MPETELDRLIAVASELRRKCPWDRVQTIDSLAPFILEESYELADAIDGGDVRKVKEELGDLLYLVLLCCLVCGESGGGIREVAEGITEKMVGRHPAVFAPGEGSAETADRGTWYRKKMEDGSGRRRFSGIPANLPALLRAEKVQHEASAVGFDWKDAAGAFEKLEEELDELKRAVSGDGDVVHELGDLLFSTVNLSRFLDANAEIALLSSVARFCSRFSVMEKELEKRGQSLEDATLDEMDSVWERCKDVKRGT